MEVLVIGLGSMGKRRIRLLKGFQQVTNIVGVDGREDRRNETTEKLNCNVCESIGEALKKHQMCIRDRTETDYTICSTVWKMLLNQIT